MVHKRPTKSCECQTFDELTTTYLPAWSVSPTYLYSLSDVLMNTCKSRDYTYITTLLSTQDFVSLILLMISQMSSNMLLQSSQELTSQER